MNSNLSKNMLANIMAFFISLVVSVWLTPFIIENLGAEAYGFIPLSQQLVNYISIITIAVNGMAARFFTYAIKSGDLELAERYFNTSLLSSAILSIIILLPFVLLTMFVDKIVNVPSYLLPDFQLSIIINVVIFIIALMGSAFGMGIFCENRLDISGNLSSTNTILRSIIIVFLLTLMKPRMWFVSLGSLIPSVILLIQNFYYFKKLLPNIKIKKLNFDMYRLKELVSSGVWSSINYIGAVLFLQIDMLVANWALGAKLAGEYTALLQISNLLRGFVATIIVVFGPSMVELYAKNDITNLVKYSNKAVKITGIIMALPVGLACGFGRPMLTLWLGDTFSKYTFAFFLMTVHLSVNLAVQPMFGIFSAANRVKIPAIVTLVMGLTNFLLAIVLSITFSLGAYGIVIASLVVLTSKNLIFTPIYSSIITKQSWLVYYKGMLTPIASVSFIILLGLITDKIIVINNWIALFISAIPVSMIYLLFIFFFILDYEDRLKIKSLIKHKFSAYS